MSKTTKHELQLWEYSTDHWHASSGLSQSWFLHQFLPFLGVHHIAVLHLFFPCQLLALISLFQFSWDVVVSWDSLLLLSHLQEEQTFTFFSLQRVWWMTANRKQFFQARAEKGLKLILLMHSFLSFRGCQTHMLLYNLLLKHTPTPPLPVFIHFPLITQAIKLSPQLGSCQSFSERNPYVAISQASSLSLISCCCLIQERRKKTELWIAAQKAVNHKNERNGMQVTDNILLLSTF